MSIPSAGLEHRKDHRNPQLGGLHHLMNVLQRNDMAADAILANDTCSYLSASSPNRVIQNQIQFLTLQIAMF